MFICKYNNHTTIYCTLYVHIMYIVYLILDTIMNKLRISIYTSMTPFSETQTLSALSACASTF